MLGKSLVVSSYVVINDGCPIATKSEGFDHVQILCGHRPNETFEIVIQHDALRALVNICTDALNDIDAGSSNLTVIEAVDR